MSKKLKATKPVGPPDGWVVSTAYQLSPQVTLSKGDACRITGEQGTFVFMRHVVNTKLNPVSEWIDLWGGSSGHAQWRSVKVDRLKHMPKKRIRTKKEPRPSE